MTNKIDVQEIIIDGEVYVKKSANPSIVDNYSIVRCDRAGVFAGEVISRKGQEAKLHNARRIWYWDGAASLSQLAMEGTSKPDNCKFPCEVTAIELMDVIEVIPCTEKARQSIQGVKVWKK